MTTIVETGRDTKHQSCGGRLVSVDGLSLPLRGAALAAEAGGGLARSVLRQTFRNDHTEPLEVLYTFPLPAEGAVAAYEFRIGERRVIGRIDRRAAARERYEQAIVEGRTAGLVDQERANLFTQRLGNVPPGVEVVVELHVDQKLRWLPEGLWEWRFPTVTAPRYLGGEGRVADAGKVSIEVAEGGTGIRASLDLVVRDRLPEGGAPRSPSHAIRTCGAADTDATSDDDATAGAVRVMLAADNGVALDRDVVVRWPVARAESGVTLHRARPGSDAPHGEHAYGLLTIVPPEGPATATLARDLIVLVDTSGSMSGRPIEMAKTVVRGLIDSLAPIDRLEMIAFSSAPRRWQRGAVRATPEIGRQAAAWVDGLVAGGGTEMTSAVDEALRPLRGDAQRQVVLVTDGQIGFEQEVFRTIRDLLPAGSRLHTVGVGSAANCALLGPAARAGRGVEVIIDFDDDPGQGVARLVEGTRGPVLIDVVIDGLAVTGTAPRRLPDLLAGAPLLASVRLNPEGGRLHVRGRSSAGAWEQTIVVPPTEAGEEAAAITALYGREAVADLELDLAAGADGEEVDTTIERIGLEFGLATRLTSWIAVSEEPTVDPRSPVKVSRIPQELPYGLSAEGLGLRSRAAMAGGRFRGVMMADSADSLPPAFLKRLTGPFEPMPSDEELLASEALESSHSATPEKVEAIIEAAVQAEREQRSALRAAAPSWRFAARWVPGTASGTHILKFEVVVAGLDWRPEAVAHLILKSGARIDVEVIGHLTTVAGAVDTGTLVMIGLRLAGHDPAEILAVEIVSAGRLLRLDP